MQGVRLLLSIALVLPAPALAQQSTSAKASVALPPIKALQFYVGRWTSRGQSRNAPADRFTTVRTSEICSWVIGGHAVECRETVTTPVGPSQGIYLLAYDSAAKQYTVYGIDDSGMELQGVGNVDPVTGKWSWTLEMQSAGQTSRWRYEFAPSTPNARIMTLLLDQGDGKWASMTNAVYTRVK
jgi:hypothetical protein